MFCFSVCLSMLFILDDVLVFDSFCWFELVLNLW